MLANAGSVPCAISPPRGCKGTLLLAALAVALVPALTATADARKGGRGHGHGFARHVVGPAGPATESSARGGFERRPLDRGGEDDGLDGRSADRRGTERGNLLALVPADWREQPPDPDWQGRRFVAPSGDAWVAFYARPAAADTRDAQLKAVAFVDGEDVTTLQRERDWLAVSGFKDETRERIFYRKVVLACGEREWRHVAFEYPAEAKRAFDRLVTSLSRALNGGVDAYCEDATVGRR